MIVADEYGRWCRFAAGEPELLEELEQMDQGQMEEAFYKDLAFGTGGLRGKLGAGTSRMNRFTVAKASQGVAAYLLRNFEHPSVAISYDSRIKSSLFSQVAAGVFAANGIQVFLYPELMPTPCLSFAVRRLGCSAGIMVTASHNPRAYNGYKVYGADGCQITAEAAREIQKEMGSLDIFADVREIPFEEGIRSGLVSYIPKEVETAFVEAVKSQSVLGSEEADRQISVVYSPLNGTGLKPVVRTLEESGFKNITVVEEQAQPDGNFPTCPYPNPEAHEAMALGLEYAKMCSGDILLATDPDCDRVGVAVRDGRDGTYTLLSGNETGILLLDYICSQRRKMDTMPKDPVCIKSIVTTGLAERIAARYGVRTVNVLTGFKYIGERIGVLEREEKEESFIFGFEESCGYLSGGYVRDKDGVNGALLVCEMAACYKARGSGLLERLEELYKEYGYCLDTLHSYEFEGSAGGLRMQEIMAGFRKGLDEVGPKRVLKSLDYKEGLDGLPKSDILKFVLEDHGSVVVRPSGTEPKLKLYISIGATDRAAAEVMERQIVEALERAMEENGNCCSRGASSCPAMPDKNHQVSAPCGKPDKNSLTSQLDVGFPPVFPAP